MNLVIIICVKSSKRRVKSIIIDMAYLYRNHMDSTYIRKKLREAPHYESKASHFRVDAGSHNKLEGNSVSIHYIATYNLDQQI